MTPTTKKKGKSLLSLCVLSASLSLDVFKKKRSHTCTHNIHVNFFLLLFLSFHSSWGQYWGEMGYMRLEAGKNLLAIESSVAWATPGAFTVHNFPCSEDGKNCNDHKKGRPNEAFAAAVGTHFYQDPSTNIQAVLMQRRLASSSSPPRSLRV